MVKSECYDGGTDDDGDNSGEGIGCGSSSGE